MFFETILLQVLEEFSLPTNHVPVWHHLRQDPSERQGWSDNRMPVRCSMPGFGGNVEVWMLSVPIWSAKNTVVSRSRRVCRSGVFRCWWLHILSFFVSDQCHFDKMNNALIYSELSRVSPRYRHLTSHLHNSISRLDMTCLLKAWPSVRTQGAYHLVESQTFWPWCSPKLGTVA